MIDRAAMRDALADLLVKDPEGFVSFIRGVFAEAGDASTGWVCGPSAAVEAEATRNAAEWVIQVFGGPAGTGSVRVARDYLGLHLKVAAQFMASFPAYIPEAGVDTDRPRHFPWWEAREVAEVLATLGYRVFVVKSKSGESYEHHAGTVRIPHMTLRMNSLRGLLGAS